MLLLFESSFHIGFRVLHFMDFIVEHSVVLFSINIIYSYHFFFSNNTLVYVAFTKYSIKNITLAYEYRI